MEINPKRLLHDLSIITSYTKTPESGCTRFSYSIEDRKTRDYLFSQMEKLGLSVKVDAIGNIRAKYGLTDKPSIMIGSHIDTVANGGKYDGLTGVLAGLEVIRVIKEEEIELTHPIELVVFAEEEGSNFGITMLGSKALTGKYQLEDLYSIRNDQGISVYDLTKNFGLDIENLEKDILKPNEVETMIELHIEQGAVLEARNKTVGIVQAIVGMKTFKITLEGISNHAGTTPMDLRSDPMVGAGNVISHIQIAAQERALPTTVGTVGKIACLPNMPNVIPNIVEFYVDVRDVDPKGINLMEKEINAKVDEVAKKHSLKTSIEQIGQSDSVKLSSKVTNIIEEIAIKNHYPYLKMNSGAVHDAAMLTNLTDVGMIFIPSIGGMSHSPDEFTNNEDIKVGCDLLLNVAIELAAKKGTKSVI